MLDQNYYNPSTAIHPGVTLQEILDSLVMSQIELANRTDLTPKTINEIIQGKNPITPETAIKLANVFGISPNFWNNLQRNYEVQVIRLQEEQTLINESLHLKRFICYKELEKWNFFPKSSNTKDRVRNLLNFFGVSSLSLVSSVQQVAFRSTKQKNLSKESLAAWLRCGELRATQIETATFDEHKLTNSLEGLRELTNEKAESFADKIVEKCASCGVAVVFVPYFKNTYVCGATRWLNSEKAMVQLSLKGGRSDIFWFTFFHELGHLLKHGKKDQFIEFEKNKSTDFENKELEADKFASDILIPPEKYKPFKMARLFDDLTIKNFAKKMNVHVGIVAGRLAHDYNSPKAYKKFEHLREKIKFVEK